MQPQPTPRDPLEQVYEHLDEFARRLPEGEQQDAVRRCLMATVAAVRDRGEVEFAMRQLIDTLHQLDEHAVGGRRREFQRQAPVVGRFLEVLQEELLPILRDAGYHV
jgi:hypothetical protein